MTHHTKRSALEQRATVDRSHRSAPLSHRALREGRFLSLLGALAAAACGQPPTSAALDAAVAPPDFSRRDAGPCAYPAATYSKQAGRVIPPDLSWEVLVRGAMDSERLAMRDLLDCDGGKGINAILVDLSASWCEPCKRFAADLPRIMQTWGPAGVRVVLLVAQDVASADATLDEARAVRMEYGLDALPSVRVGIDPKFSATDLPPRSLALPYGLLIDPRTMRIARTTEGYDGAPHVSVLELARSNGAP